MTSPSKKLPFPKIDEEMIKTMEKVESNRKDNRRYCYHCKTETKQTLLFEKGVIADPMEVIHFDETGKRTGSVWTIEAHIWKIFQCQGCEKINSFVFERYSPFEDDILIHQFPVKDFRPFPIWVTHLNKDYTQLFCEIYHSLNVGSKRLPIMGVRTLLDMFMLEKIGDAGSFTVKLKKLFEQKYISNSACELLELVLDYGNATIHRGYEPTNEEINEVFDILENILHIEALKVTTKNLDKSKVSKK